MRRRTFLSLALAATLLLAPLHAADRRIVAIADIHGAGDAFVSILQRAGLVNEGGHWSGGRTVLVQTGDVMDRGPDVRELLDRLLTLESEAKRSGGRIERLLGNHEIMNLVGFTRDATPEIFASWADAGSDARRERAYADAARIAGGLLDKDTWMAAHPPGYIEYRDAFGPGGRYGKWLRTRPAVVKIGDTIFMHAGIAPGSTPSIDAINADVRNAIQTWDAGARYLEQHKLALPFYTFAETIAAASAELERIVARHDAGESLPDDAAAVRALQPLTTIRQSSLFKADGPMWFRGYSSWSDEEGAPLMAALLTTYHARRFVTGHTPQANGTVRSRFDGGVYLIDTGMLGPPHFPGGRASALEIVGDRVTPLYATGQ